MNHSVSKHLCVRANSNSTLIRSSDSSTFETARTTLSYSYYGHHNSIKVSNGHFYLAKQDIVKTYMFVGKETRSTQIHICGSLGNNNYKQGILIMPWSPTLNHLTIQITHKGALIICTSSLIHVTFMVLHKSI